LQPPPEKKPRIDDPQKQEEYSHPDVALQSQEMAEDESQQEEIDEAAVKRLCIQVFPIPINVQKHSKNTLYLVGTKKGKECRDANKIRGRPTEIHGIRS
jgi:hypothetical protein